MAAGGFDMGGFLSLLQNAFAGQFSPRQEDGLAKLAVGGLRGGPGLVGWGNQPMGPSIAGLSGPDLVRAWARMDRNPRGQELADMAPGSQYANWWGQQLGDSTGFLRGARGARALGMNLGGGMAGMNNNQFLRFMSGLM